MALVPYDGGQCCSGFHHHLHRPPPPPPPSQSDWGRNSCCRSPPPGSNALQTMPGVEERLLQLEGDKDSLHLQVALLSDQLDCQTEKIGDLERLLDDKKDVLQKTEDVLQREMLTRSSLETKKLELMSNISELKLNQVAVERDNTDLRRRLMDGNRQKRYVVSARGSGHA